MANFVASVSPSAPIIAIYIQEMVRMLALPHGAALTAPIGALPMDLSDGWAGEKVGEVLNQMRHANRADARAAAAVRDAKRFVQVQVADIRADEAGAGEADLGVHVRAVHVNLAAVRVDDFADLADGFLEHAVRGRIGDHQAARWEACGLRLAAQVRHINVAEGRRRRIRRACRP
jgi:hypothetical protein